MPPLQVKDCPDSVYEQLRICAAEEHRSISNQALTIIEDYLEARSKGLLSASRTSGKNKVVVYRKEGEVNYAEKRRKLFAEIRKMRKIPISEDRPRADIMLAQIREEEAR